MTMRESVCDNVLDVPAGQWIPAFAGMTMNEDGARCAGMTRKCKYGGRRMRPPKKTYRLQDDLWMIGAYSPANARRHSDAGSLDRT